MLLSIDHALEAIDCAIAPVSSEILPIESTCDRIVAEDIFATYALPRFNNSAMDGYAVQAQDSAKEVKVVGTLYAGDVASMELHQGEAIKIMTGAPIPKGCNAIVPKEQILSTSQSTITLPLNIQPQQHIRYAGEDISPKSLCLQKGDRISPYSIALLASQGITHMSVYRKLKVVLFGTGDELRPHYETIQPHQLYNSNTPMLLARSAQLGCDVRFIQTQVDTLQALEEAIVMAQDADILITSGGVSVGDKDFTKEAFANVGMVSHFQGVKIKPGKPTSFGMLGRCAVLNLPGNPLAAMVNYELFVRVMIAKMSGERHYHHATIQTTLAEPLKIKSGKYSVILGQYKGESFLPLAQQRPGMISPLQEANTMLITTPDVSHLPKGANVHLLPLTWECRCASRRSLYTQPNEG